MFITHKLFATVFCAILWIPLLHAQDFTKYRDFQLGMNLDATVKLAHMELSEAKLIHQRPALIQELEWQPHFALASMPEADPLKEILFSFYNGQLFRMMIVYDHYKTDGMTPEDMIEAISAKYGLASRPVKQVLLFPSFEIYNDSEKVLACWEDATHSFNLFRSSSTPSYGVLAYSKRLDTLARSAINEANRLDKLEAPQREIDSQKKEDEDERAAQEKARPESKANFRP
jgi:hypothetical protein